MGWWGRDRAEKNKPPDAPIKDETAQHSLPDPWRPTIRQIVAALVAQDYALASGVDGVDPVSAEDASQMSDYIEDYGATLIDLPDDAWRTSVAQWMGTHWDVLVDLWTAEEGRSDLVLGLTVSEADDGYRFKIDMVYVP